MRTTLEKCRCPICTKNHKVRIIADWRCLMPCDYKRQYLVPCLQCVRRGWHLVPRIIEREVLTGIASN